MTGQKRKLLGLGLFLGSCFAIALFLFHLAGTDLVPGDEPYRVQAVVPTAVNLTDHADVRQAGVMVGQVSGLRARGNATIVMLELDDEHTPVYRDARVLVRSKTALGESYVQLEPGRPAAGTVPSGGVLPIKRAGEATQIDEVLSLLDRGGRRDLQLLLNGVGVGLDGRGADLNRMLEATSAAIRHGGPVAETLAADRTHVASLIDSFGQVMRALGDRRDAIRVLTRQANAAAQAVAARDAELRDTLAALPPFLRQTRGTAGRLGAFSTDATPVIADLRVATELLVPAVGDLRAAAPAGRRVIEELDRFARAALPATRRLPAFSRAADGAVPPLAAVLRQANPLLAYLAPYSREMGSYFALQAATSAFKDGVGHTNRTIVPISRSYLVGGLTPEQERMLQELSGPLDTRGINAYPKPGEAGELKPFSGDYPRLLQDPPYTR